MCVSACVCIHTYMLIDTYLRIYKKKCSNNLCIIPNEIAVIKVEGLVLCPSPAAYVWPLIVWISHY